MTQKLVLFAALSVILITTFLGTCDANDLCTLKQGIAFVANQPLGAVVCRNFCNLDSPLSAPFNLRP